jgi:hypothetical protein
MRSMLARSVPIPRIIGGTVVAVSHVRTSPARSLISVA